MFVRWFSMVLHSSFKVVSVWCYSFSMIFRCELSLRAALWVQTSLVSPTFPLDLWPAHTTAFWLLPSQWIRLRIIFAIANEDRNRQKRKMYQILVIQMYFHWQVKTGAHFARVFYQKLRALCISSLRHLLISNIKCILQHFWSIDRTKVDKCFNFDTWMQNT